MRTRVFKPLYALWLSLAVLILITSGPSFALSAISVAVNGQQVNFDQPPVVKDGRVLVPLRGIFESLGASVSYDAATHAVTARHGDTMVNLTLNSASAMVNGATVPLDVPAQSIGGRTLVPLRFISETLGAKVTWDAASRSIAVTSASAPSASYQPPQPVVVAVAPPVEEPPHISHVILDNSGPLRPGDTLRCVVMGSSDAIVTLHIQGLAANIPLEETSPGRYEGKFVIPAAAGLSDETHAVVAYLTRDGMESSMQAPSPLTLAAPSGNIFVHVLSPTRHERVSSDFTVTGTTLPFARVEVRSPQLHRTTVNGQADATGHFSIPVHMGYEKGRHDVDLDVTATDQNGRISRKQHFSIAVGD